jgi:hypothetical protein
MLLNHSIFIGSTPEAVLAFFDGIETNYRRWHPDHRLFRWEEGRGLRPGVVFRFEETIGGKLMKKRVVFTRIYPQGRIEFAFTNRLLRLVLPYIRFDFPPEDGGIRFTQEIPIRTGPLGAWLNRREFDAVREHMRQEAENLKEILESA